MALFALASVGCGASDSLVLLLILRGVQAIGAAGALVAAFELLDGSTPGPGRRMWVAASVFGIAVGPALGGALTQAFSWRAIFLAQAPLLIPGLLVAIRAARAEVVPAAVGRDPDQPSYRLPPRAAILALLSASLTAVIFLVVLLLVSGWSIEPLDRGPGGERAADLGARRVADPGRCRDARRRRLPAGRGRGRLPRAPSGASAWWTVAPQVLAGAGMGMALPALSGELMPERTRHDVSRLLSIRHAGIAIALAALAPLISANLTTTVDEAREQGPPRCSTRPCPRRTRSRSRPSSSPASTPTIPAASSSPLSTTRARASTAMRRQSSTAWASDSTTW